MVLNGDKFELVQFGFQGELKISTKYYCGQQEIIAKEVVKDIGVNMSNNAA